ncbi:MAG: PorP/SprF family type IX secretion system membrane protein, partial [Muribaculaceae bacterium]|nr:PorP/SprF family type IX secretion system membrane protein [Muribaculaceae bacterium]
MKCALHHIIILLLTLAGASVASAQTDPVLTQYFQAPTFFNPAAIGSEDYVRIRLGSRMQWVGVDGAPSDFIIAADSPFKISGKRFGAGVVMNQESIGLYSTMDFSGQVGFTFPLNRKKPKWGALTVALQVGYMNQKFKGSEVYIPDDDDYHESSDDAIPQSDVTGDALDLGVGLWYTHPRFSAGLSCTRVTSPTVKLRTDREGGGASGGAAE